MLQTCYSLHPPFLRPIFTVNLIHIERQPEFGKYSWLFPPQIRAHSIIIGHKIIPPAHQCIIITLNVWLFCHHLLNVLLPREPDEFVGIVLHEGDSQQTLDRGRVGVMWRSTRFVVSLVVMVLVSPKRCKSTKLLPKGRL